MKSRAELSMQRDTDEDIMRYIREMQSMAPIEAEGLYQFLTGTRRKVITRTEVKDRLIYLTDKGLLKRNKEWSGGELVHWTCTAHGMDLLDGNVPPDYWERN